MSRGVPVLGYGSLTAAVEALAAAGVPDALIRELIEQELGRRLSGSQWSLIADRATVLQPQPLTEEARRTLACAGWVAPAQIRRLRPCLGCGGRFKSTGAHHRFCDCCRERLAQEAPGFEGVAW